MQRDADRIIGNSVALTHALEQVSRLASINRPVLIIGERGTGKELAAERLHFLSSRWDGPLMKVNCAAIAEQLLESELFGHEPGAFTGATRTHHGRFERADGGTLFLDELATMSQRLQEKLLRLVEYGEFERLGGQTTLQVDVRVAAATNADLPAMAARGEFREDLLDRLSFDVVHLPPLRHRLSDIPELAHHFAIHICAELGWDLFAGFTDRAAMTLLKHHWPGNIRELKNVVERSIHRWGDATTMVDDIVLDPFSSPFSDWQTPVDEPAPALPIPVVRSTEHISSQRHFASAVASYEKQLLLDSLHQHHQHQGNTARALSLSYDQLRGLLRKYGLTPGKRGAQAA